MDFRTPIGKLQGSFMLDHSDRIVLLGSCFADNIGQRLEQDGFDVVHNPLGPLFNPASIEMALSRRGEPFGVGDLVCHDGQWHALQGAYRYRGDDTGAVLHRLNADYMLLHTALSQATAIMLTFGTTRVFTYGAQQLTAANCHKLPGTFFTDTDLCMGQIEALPLFEHYPVAKRLMTLSPVKYPGQGLAKGFLAKATLRVAIETLCRRHEADYFPAYEIVTDDLRDYRFYAPDMRHPSDVAADYIYTCLCDTYMSDATRAIALEHRKTYLRQQHRPLS